MKRNNLIVIILFSVLGVLLLVYFLMSGQNERRYRWHESYKAGSDQPYGTLFIKKLLEGYRPGEKFVFNDKKPLYELLDSAAIQGPTDYIFIGQSLYLDEDDIDALLDFIYSGNDALIACNDLSTDLIDPAFEYECIEYLYTETDALPSATMNFYHAALHTGKGYTYAYSKGGGPVDRAYEWHSLTPDVLCDSTRSIIPLGYMQPEKVNFFRLPYGKGNLYVHTNPLVFTNYFLVEPEKATYAAGIFSHLRGKDIIWDEFSKAPFAGNNEPYNSPLSYIMQHDSLKYAWWMMLGGAVLYTLFTAKRKQRVIPVLEEKVNTSLEFVKMISALHFQNGNHLDIAHKKMKHFLHFIRAKYGIHTQNFTAVHIKRLAERSKVETKDIQDIFNAFDRLGSNADSATAEKGLMNLYGAIDKFYKHCK